MLKLYGKSPKKHSEICGNIKSLLHLEQQLALYIYTCLSHVLGKLQNNCIVYIFAHNNLCLILSLLCSTANNVNLGGTLQQQIGKVLDTGRKFMEKHVSLG